MIKLYSFIATGRIAIARLTNLLQDVTSPSRKRCSPESYFSLLPNQLKPEYITTNLSQMQTFTKTTKSFKGLNRWIMTLIIAVMSVVASTSANAQIAVTVTGAANTTPALNATYTDLATALGALNAVTGMTGPVTFTLAPGTSETAPATGLAIGSATLNPVLSSTNTVTIVKAAGSATVLNAGTGTATAASAVLDGILRLDGADYITIDGLTFTDGNSASATVAMEYGIGLFKRTAGDGCNTNTIQNCIFNMQRINNTAGTAPVLDGATAILVINSTSAAAVTALTPTNGGTLATNGTNSGNKFYGNTINGGNIGIGISGYAATTGVGPTPTAATFLGDLNNDIGGVGALAATTGNTILNFGGGAATNAAAGIRALNQWGLNISNNSVNNNNGSGVNHVAILRGIYGQSGTSANVTINYNTITVKGAGTTTALTGIENVIGATSSSNTVTINNNIIQNCTYTTATTATFTGILAGASAATQTMNNNQVINNTIGASGTGSACNFQGIYSSATNTTTNMSTNTVSNNQILNSFGAGYGLRNSTGTLNIDNNTVSSLTMPNSAGATSATIYGIYDAGSPVTENYTNNNVNNLTISGTSTATSHAIYGIYILTASGVKTVSGNSINNLSFSSSGAGYSTVAGIRDAYNSTANIFNNTIHTISSTGTTPTVAGLYLGSTTITTFNVYNNLIGNLTTPASTGHNLYGIYCGNTGTNINLYYNTVYLNGTSSGTGFASSAVFMSSTTPTVTLQNNILVNLSTPTGTGITAALRRTSTTITAYGSTSNNNLFYAGTASSTRLIYYDGTNSDQTMATFKTRVTPRETLSFSEAVSSTAGVFFQSLTGPATGSSSTFLHLVAGITTQAESGGIAVSGITTDYDGNTRNATKPDVGADEFVGVSPAPTIANASTPTAACTATSHVISADITTTSGTITSVMLNYNNGSAGSASMTLGVSPTYSATIPAASPVNSTVTWSITATNSLGLSTTFTSTSYKDAPLTGATATAVASVNPLCAGSSTNLTGSVSVNGVGDATSVGTATTATALTDELTAFCNRRTTYQHQAIFTASELQAAGLGVGNITGIKYTINAVGDASTTSNYTVKMGTTALAALTTSWVTTGLTTVRNSATYTHAVGVNTITFNTPFNWDGVSNIIIDVTHGGINSINNATTQYTTQAANMQSFGYNGATTATLSLNRLNVIFTGQTAVSIPVTSATWDNGGGTGNPVSVTPLTSTTYTGTLTAAGCTINTTALTVTVNALPTTPTGSGSTQCGTGTASWTATSALGGGESFRWYATNVSTAILGTSSTYTESISATTTRYLALWNGTCESSRAAIAANVTSADPLTATVNNNAPCPSVQISLSATQTGTTNTYTYTWKEGTTTLGTGIPFLYTPSAAGAHTYTVYGVDGTCNVNSSVVVNVQAVPVINTPIAVPPTICTGQQSVLTATTNIITSGSSTLGAGATTASSYDGIFYHLYGGNKSQFMVKASELTTLGFTAGNITSLGINMSTVSSFNYEGFAISMAQTTNTSMSAGLLTTGLSTVFTGTGINGGYTPITGTNTFSITSFNWDGTSNIVIQFCWSNNTTGGTSNYAKIDAPGFVSSAYFRADSQTPAVLCPQTTGTGTTSNRPQFIFTGQKLTVGAGSLTWSWDNGGGSGNSVTVTPSATTTYTVTAVNPATTCFNTATVAVTVNPLPAAPGAGSFGANPQCGDAIPTGSLTGSGAFHWFTSPDNGVTFTPVAGETGPSLTVTSISTTTTFYVSVNNGTCESNKTAVTATVNSPDPISASSNGPVCANSTVNLTATVTNGTGGNNYTYSWTALAAAGSGIPTPVTGNGGTGTFGSPATTAFTPTLPGTYIYTVIGKDGGCTATNTVSVVVNALPVIDGITASPTSVCDGSAAILNVFSAGGGYVNGTNPQPTGYCTATFSSTTEDDIGQVTFAGINNPAVRPTPQQSNATAINTYTDYTSTTTGIVTPGVSYPITVYHFHSTTDVSANFANVYIDFNRNGVFTDAGETFSLSKPGATFLEDFVGTIAIPLTAPSGITRMRVVVKEGAITAPCASIGTWGEAEDYLLNVQKTNPQNPSLTYSWSPAVTGSGASVSAIPTVSPTLYAVDVSNANCTIQSSVSVSIKPLPTAPYIVNNPGQCGTAVPNAEIASTAGVDSTGTYRWYLQDAPGGTALAGESGRMLMNYSIPGPTHFYVSEVGQNGCESPRTDVFVDFTLTADVLSLSASPSPICLGQSTSFSFTKTGSTNTFSYSYTATPQLASGLTYPSPPATPGVDTLLSDPAITVTPTVAGSYTYTLKGYDSDKGCVSVATTTVVVNPLPNITSFTVTPTTVCEGATLNLAALSAIGGAGTATVGSGANSNTNTTAVGTLYGTYWGNGHAQILYRASELTAAGFGSGNITSLGIVISNAGSSQVLNGFTIKMAATAATAITTFQAPTFTTVLGPINYTPVVGTNTHTLTTPFAWDGVSNIIIDYCFANSITGTTAMAYINNYTTTAFGSFVNYNADGATGAGACTNTTVSNASSNRPNLIFGGFIGNNFTGNFTWQFNPGAISGGTSGIATTIASTSVPSYTATATALGCSNTTNPFNITVNPLPVAPIATNVSRCGPGAVSLTATANGGGTLKWYTTATLGTAVFTGSPYNIANVTASTSYWVSETNTTTGCEGMRAPVNISLTPTPDLAIVAGGLLSFCPGGSVTLNAAGSGTDASYITADNFTWASLPSANAGLSSAAGASISVAPTAAGSYDVTVSATNASACSNTATVTVVLNANPVISSVTANPVTICNGSSSTLTGLASGSANATYTAPGTTSSTGGDAIQLVAFETINNATTTGGTNGYVNYTATIPSVFLNPGSSYTISVSVEDGGTEYAGVWFDWNRNGVFESSEFTNIPLILSTTYDGTASITVPANASIGETRMRVRSKYNSAILATDGATSYSFGETEDYLVTVVSPALTWSWDNGVGTGNPKVVSPAGSTSYIATLTNTSTGCFSTSAPVNVAVLNVTANVVTVPPICIGGTTTLTATSTPGLPVTYSWVVDGTTTPVLSTVETLTVSPTATTVYRVNIQDLCGNIATTTSSVNVNSLPTVTINETGVSICDPATKTLTVNSPATASPSYQWIKDASNILGAAGATYTVSGISSGNYAVKITDGVTGCSKTSTTVSITVNPSPATVSILPASATICNGASVNLTASGGTTGGSGTATLGTGATTEFNSSPYRNGANANKQQYLILGSELIAAGIQAGNITSVQFNVTSNGTPALTNYQISIGSTTNTSMTTSFITTPMTVVYGPQSYTTVAGLNTHTFTTPFVWDGSSNIVVQVCHETTTPNSSATVTADANAGKTVGITSFSAGSLCGTATGGTTSANRPKMVFTYAFLQQPIWSWTPTTGLTPSNTATVAAAPTASITYTARSTNSYGCFAESSVAVTVNPVTIISADAAPATQLVGQNTTADPLTVTATGTGTITYQWFSNATNSSTGGTVVGTGSSYAPSTTAVGTTYYYAIATGTCGTATSSVVRVDVVNANTNFWVGGGTTNWSTPANWSLNAVPTTLNDAVIPTGNTPYPILSTASTARNISVQSGATVSLNGNTLTLSGGATGAGTFIGSATSSLAVGGNSTLSFATGAGGVVKNLNVNGNGTTATLATALDITGGTGTANTFGTVKVANGATLASGGFLTFKSTASGTARLDSGNVTGDVIVERYIPGNPRRAWRMLSIPTKGSQTIKEAWQEGATAANFNPKPTFGTDIPGNFGPYAALIAAGFDEYAAGTSITSWDSPSGSWSALTATTNSIQNSRGYSIYIRGDRTQTVSGLVTTTTPTTLRTKGTLYIGDQPAVAVGPNKFEFMGNNFVSAVDFTRMTKPGLSNVFYIWDPKVPVAGANSAYGGYVTFSGTNGFAPVPATGSYTASNSVIESGQSFFVVGGASGGSLAIPEAAKASSSRSNVFRPMDAADQKLMANLYIVDAVNPIMADANVSVFNNIYANAVDGDDAVKLVNAGENFAIRSHGTNLVVEGRQVTSSYDTTQFWMWNIRQAVQYRLELITQNMNVAGRTAFLIDNYPVPSTTQLDLAGGTTSYNFTVSSDPLSIAADRFKVVYRQVEPSPVPVTFVSISANKAGNGIKIDWKVGAESGVRQYEVQRSNDGRNFVSIGSSQATGNNGGEQNYTWVDAAPLAGSNFYRIKSTGIAGEIKYTNIAKVLLGDVKPGFTVAPNPVEGSVVNVQFKNQAQGRYVIRLLSNTGQTMFISNVEHAGGNSTQSLSLPVTIARGSYQLEIIAPDKTKTVENLFINTLK